MPGRHISTFASRLTKPFIPAEGRKQDTVADHMQEPWPPRAVRSANLLSLMERSQGSPEVRIGLLDGPVAVQHAAFARAHLIPIEGPFREASFDLNSPACTHGTFVAGVLVADRNAGAPSICPGCSLVVNPIFREASGDGDYRMPTATADALADALKRTVDAEVHVINLSASFQYPSINNNQAITAALDYAARRDVVVVAAVGNQATMGSSQIIRHAAVLPVVAADSAGRPLDFSNLCATAGRRGLLAPGSDVTSINAAGGLLTWTGTSVAAPFVSGTAALLKALFPAASGRQLRAAIIRSSTTRRRTVTPPPLDGGAAYQALTASLF